jgi:SAM-dependent methyltransferase
VLSVLGVALAPRPRRTCRELLRVLRPDGLLVLAVPTRAALAATAIRIAGETPRWGSAEDALTYLAAAEVETRDHPLRLGFESMDAAWEAFAGPFGMPDGARVAFEAEVADRSPAAGPIGLRDHWLIVTARHVA